MSRSRGFGLLVAGSIVSTLGSSIYLVTLVLYVAEQTGSAVTLGLVQLVSYAPAALLGVFAGGLADRFDRRNILVATDAARAALMIGTGAYGLVTGSIPLPLLIGATVGISAFGVFFVPSSYAITPELVPPERIRAANAVKSASMQVSNLGGSALGGFLYAALGAPLLTVANGVSFLLSAVSELFIPSRSRRASTAPPVSGRVRVRVREGLSAARASGAWPAIVVHASINLTLPLVVTGMPFLITDVWHLPDTMFGVLFAVVLAGGVSGYAAISLGRPRSGVERSIYRASPVAIAAAFAGIALLAFRPPVEGMLIIPLVALFAFAAGAAVGSEYLVTVARIQENTDPAVHGRLFALLEVATALAVPLGYGVASAVAAVTSELWVLPAIGATVALVIAIGSYGSSTLGRFISAAPGESRSG
jgi:MFS family permease